jgi:cell division protein FtsW (lipid II flippase)
MTTTVTTSEQRRHRGAARGLLTRAAITQIACLTVASCCTIIATGLVYRAKIQRAGHTGNVSRVLNLNTIQGADDLLPVLSGVIDDEGDRRFTAERIARFVMGTGSRNLDHVGDLARLHVSASDAKRFRRLSGRAGSGGQTGVRLGGDVSLLSPTELAQLKPRVAVRGLRDYRSQLFWWLAYFVLAFHAAGLLSWWIVRKVDGVLLGIAYLLAGLGFAVMVSVRDPVRDTLVFVPFAQGAIVGLAAFGATLAVDFRRAWLRQLTFLPLLCAFALSALLILFGSGPGSSQAKVNLGPVQPVEGIRLLLILFLAGYFARKWQQLRSLREKSLPDALRRWNIPRIADVQPLVASVGLGLVFFGLQGDLGPALLFASLFLVMYAVTRARVLLVTCAFAMLIGGFWAGYELGWPRTVSGRVAMWWSPWDNGVRGGSQVAHSLWAFASGEASGTGLGLGDPERVPAVHTDMVLAAIGEQLGFVGIAVVFALFIAFFLKAFRIALRSTTEYECFLALAIAMSLALQLCLIACGALDLLPLSGVVTPFLSYGRSSMVANLIAVGALCAIEGRSIAETVHAPFARPVRWLRAVTVALLIVVVGRAADVQLFRSVSTMTMPMLGIQADGGQRYEYNPRLLAVAELVPRGTIYDRRGVPMATSRGDELQNFAAAFSQMGLRIDPGCASEGRRCYPLGGMSFHLLGDVTTKANWAASNTSFEERDADRRLRGYDDHARIVEGVDRRTGRTSRLIRRDYRDLIPLFRTRFRSRDAAAAAILDQPHDLRMSIDAALQVRVAEMLKAQVLRLGKARGAAVVLDAGSGELLASASYPFPADDGRGAAAHDDVGEQDGDELMDRARYGVYPPGSTFKLVTALAALKRGPENVKASFKCQRLPDGRIGVQLPGMSRPIRDDVEDRVPHGVVDMRKGLVHSCNAYFAQLGRQVGARALLDTALAFDIHTVPDDDVRSLQRDLPYAAYGQGHVLVTPMKMARVAAAIAAGGRLSAVHWDDVRPVEPARAAVDAASARTIGEFMREVVTDGTGRSLRGAPIAVAGKTGTAEVAAGASHSWFVGFAPYRAENGHAIAFAVLIENGGYGGVAAAPVAAGIVAAAHTLGVIK